MDTHSHNKSDKIEHTLKTEQKGPGLAKEITNAVPVGICLTRDHIISFANATFLKMTGYTARELKDQSLSIFYPDKAVFERPGSTGRLSGGEGFFRSQDRWICKNGTFLYCSVRCCPVDDRPGEQIWVIADVTERIRLEAQRQDLKRQLVKAQKMEALGILSGGIAHDFNNILSPIMGYAQLLLLDAGDENQKRYITGILKAAERSRDLISQILSFSRLREEETRPVQIQPLAKEVGKLLADVLPATICVKINVDPGCGRIMADPSQIYQVIMNLCTNAYQAMSERGGTLEVKVSRQDIKEGNSRNHQGPYVVLTVSDTGLGMTEEQKEHIFKPYYTTKSPDNGTGLGLAVVHGIVQRTGGSIQVKTGPGLGSEFSIFFPELMDKTGREDETSRPVTGDIRGCGHVLLVDDEPEVAKATEALLLHLGYQVTTVLASPRALRMFEQSPGAFDLVVTDQTMPDITGSQLAASIKCLRSGIPVVLLTGYSNMLPDPDNTLFDATLFKPVDMRKLGQTLCRVTAGLK